MAYSVDPQTGDVVIGGFEKGIGASPYSGLTDLKSVNISSVPGEAGINFSTSSVTQTFSANNISATSAGDTLNINLTGLTTNQFLENGQAIYFTGSTISSVSNNTLYYILASAKLSSTSQSIRITPTYGSVSAQTIGNSGTASTFTINLATPKFFDSMNYGGVNSNFLIDSLGQVWSDVKTTGGCAGGSIATNSWTYTGNPANNAANPNGADTTANGNGLVYWRTAYGTPNTQPGDFDGWLFVFRDGDVDYMLVNQKHNGSSGTNIGNGGTWNQGWNITSGGTLATPTTAFLSGSNIASCPHNAIVGPDGNMYFVDNFTTWKIEQTDIVTPKTFSPGDNTSFISVQAHNLPVYEIATCIAPLGTNFIIGGRLNQAYIWDGVQQLANNNPILLAESYVKNIVTVNTNAYIFCGNRGNIYITNGAQATPFIKVPDHVSGSSEPYFIWGGAIYNKNKLYFGVQAQDNAGNALSGYGGVWCYDLSLGSLYLSNQLSYGTYNGYASAFYSISPLPLFQAGSATEPAGIGLFIGWVNTANTTYGIDNTTSSLYVGGQSYIISDLIPIGTFLKPTTPAQVEFKLATPLLTGETIELQVASSWGTNPTFTSALITNGDGSLVSGNSQNFPIQESQWLLVKTILTSGSKAGLSNNNSFNRITQLRIVGATGQISGFSALT